LTFCVGLRESCKASLNGAKNRERPVFRNRCFEGQRRGVYRFDSSQEGHNREKKSLLLIFIRLLVRMRVMRVCEKVPK
jgi:hypothetical protein